MKHTINAHYFAACSLAASNEYTRYYLNGISIEESGGHIIMVGTDGHRLFTCRDSASSVEKFAPYIVKTIDNKPLIQACGESKADKLELDHESKQWRTLNEHGATLKMGLFELIDGTFPEWRRVIPKITIPKQSSIQSKYVADFHKAAKIICEGRSFTLNFWLDNYAPGIVTLDNNDDFLGVIMPMRGAATERPEFTAPSWVK